MRSLKDYASTLLLGIALSAGCHSFSSASDDTYVATAGEAVVKTAQGELQGFRDRGVYTFRGVPYAKAARFMAPTAPDAWSGVRLATNYGAVCPVPDMTAVSTDEQFNPHRYLPASENCQSLNIWTPEASGAKKRPVLVFLHGGGFTNGSSIEGEGYDGRNFADLGDAVVVTLNHRLNVLGALDLSAFGDRYKASSNPGMRDIVAALQWVHQNINMFGGDPANVTIMGQSGGGGKVRTLMGIADAKDLFAKAIVMSGTGSSAANPKDVSAAIAKHTLENLGLTAETVAQIETTPYPALLAASMKALKQTEADGLGKAISWRPSVDGSFIPADPVTEGWQKYSSDKPLMIGNVMEETTTVIGNNNSALYADNWTKWSKDQVLSKLTEKFGAKAQGIADAWQTAYPRDPLSRVLVFANATRTGVLGAADVKVKSGAAPVFVYLYKWNPPVLDGIAGAWHVSDVPMALYNADRTPQSFGGGEAARSMSFDMARSWINFMRTSNPSNPGIPDWTAYTPENGATMLFDDYTILGRQHDKALLDLMGNPNKS